MSLTKEQHDIFVNWVEKYIVRRKSISHNIDTSDIREAFMSTYKHGFYLNNNDVNDIMFELGFRAANFANDPYLHFNISSQSRAVQELRRMYIEQARYQKYE